MLYRTSELDVYNSVGHDFYVTSMFKRYELPLDEDRTVLVVSTTSSNATYWIIAYTVLVTMIFMAACELATLMVLTFFRIGRSRTRHAMLVAYYNAGSPSRILPLMVGYVYNGLFRCRRSGRWAVDWTAVTASFLLFSIAFSLLSGDMLTKFFLGGKALIRGNVAPANPNAIYYPDFDEKQAKASQEYNAVFNAYKGLRAPGVYQAISRKTSMGYDKLHEPGRIEYYEEIVPVKYTSEMYNATLDSRVNITMDTTQRKFYYKYNITGYELGLRDAPGLVFAVNGSCATYHANRIPDMTDFEVIASKTQFETTDIYPYFLEGDRMTDIDTSTIVPLNRENYTAPWVFFHFSPDNYTIDDGGWEFQLVPHTAHRLSRSENSGNGDAPLDPWYETELNPEWNETLDEPDSAYNMPYRVRRGRPPLRCIQNDTYTYNGKTVNHVEKLPELLDYGLKLSPLLQFVLLREFGLPVFAPILGYAPFASLASGVHFVPNERRLDAVRANISTDIRELIEIGYVYSREVVRNTVLLLPGIRNLQTPDPQLDQFMLDAANHPNYTTSDPDFLLDSMEVAALSVHTLIATPVVCVFLWIVVLTWTWIFNTQSKLDNNSASGRHGLRRSGLQATQLYLFLDEQMSSQRKWSGRQTNAPFVRELDEPEAQQPPPGDGRNQAAEKLLDGQGAIQTPDSWRTTCDFPQPKVVRVSDLGEINNSEVEEEGNTVWGWVKQNIFGIRRSNSKVRYEVVMTREWDPAIAPVKRSHIREDV